MDKDVLIIILLLLSFIFSPLLLSTPQKEFKENCLSQVNMTNSLNTNQCLFISKTLFGDSLKIGVTNIDLLLLALVIIMLMRDYINKREEK